ncbi:hypothetical protein DY240_20870 [Jiangella rhizosphaerae]|uniref:Uncharacterized protein n=1 Tax=Jiangella rhizosphaerae TaxID=2293569 RepID=A0A418KLM8_9ACTN|nr:hypothetical protein DY240_20870 [Jiangella rhizosphaerae]
MSGQHGFLDRMKCATHSVRGFLDENVRLINVAIVRQIGVPERFEHIGERVALALPTPTLAIGLQAVGSACRMGVGPPQQPREVRQALRERQ